jgi:hypothetical protein
MANNKNQVLGQPYQEQPSKMKSIMQSIADRMVYAGTPDTVLAQQAAQKQRGSEFQSEMDFKNRQLQQQKELKELELKGREEKASQGKILPEGAIMKVTDYERGTRELSLLGEKLAKQSDVVGPISGLQKFNPWATESRSLQADIDRVKQLVGKALEGGVLRKEDEEKYKKILAQITDTPQVAKHKIAEILRDINTNRNNYLNNLSRAGYNTKMFEGTKIDLTKIMQEPNQGNDLAGLINKGIDNSIGSAPAQANTQIDYNSMSDEDLAQLYKQRMGK